MGLYRALAMAEPPPAYRIAPIASADPLAVDALLDEAFGPDRRRRTAYRIRDGMAAIPQLSFAALGEDDALLGSLQCWPVALDWVTPLTLVGPVAVAPTIQRGGLGRAMMQHMVDVADATAADPLVLIGDPEYYGRFFNFDARFTAGWTVPGPVDRRRLLTRVADGMTLPLSGHLGPRRPSIPLPSTQNHF